MKNDSLLADPRAEIEKIKRTGAKKAIYDRCNTLLWDARSAIEDARNDGLRSFGKQMTIARAALAAAETLYREWKTL